MCLECMPYPLDVLELVLDEEGALVNPHRRPDDGHARVVVVNACHDVLEVG